jgi:filamin
MRSLAGLGALGISVEGAHRSDLELKSNGPSEYTLQYKPHEPGIYLLNVKFGDDHVTGKQQSSRTQIFRLHNFARIFLT